MDLAEDTLLDQLRYELPIALTQYALEGRRCGLIVVDVVNGFCTSGCGPLAPSGEDPAMDRMIRETDALARRFAAEERPIFAFLDTHTPGKPEPPYPPHCEAGTGHENLVPALRWLEECAQATLYRKDCIDSYLGAIDPATGRNRLAEWIDKGRLETVIVVGVCTDICVMDLALSLLSARNHGLTPGLADVVVFEPACATYDLPRSAALRLGLPATAAHPRAEAHHVGLWVMAARGAILAGDLV